MFNNRLKQVRELRNISQEELAKKLKLAPSTVSMWEKGERRPKIDVLIKIATILEVSTDYLLGVEVKKDSDVKTLNELYTKLDAFDKGQVLGIITTLLNADKYKKGQEYA